MHVNDIEGLNFFVYLLHYNGTSHAICFHIYCKTEMFLKLFEMPMGHPTFKKSDFCKLLLMLPVM